MYKYDVLVVGDANIDLVVEGCKSIPLPGQEIRVGDMTTNVGGGAALCAMGLSKLGLKTIFHGVLGSDIYGDFIMREFRNLKIEVYPMSISKTKKTGISIAVFGERDRSFITYEGSNTEIDLESIELETVKQARHIHITGYNGRRKHNKYMDFIRRLKKTGITISTDVGWDDTGDWYEGLFELLSYVDVFFINEVEALNYCRCGNVNDSLEVLSRYCKTVAVKMGPKGAIGKQDTEIAYEEAFPVEVVDTTGAGDSFNAGFLYGYLKGFDLKKCLMYGNACGAYSVTKPGGNTAFPDIATLEGFIKSGIKKFCDM